MAVGVVWVCLPLLVPLPGTALIGGLFVVLGALAVFVLPEWPFYKLGAIWGLAFGLAGVRAVLASEPPSTVRTSAAT